MQQFQEYDNEGFNISRCLFDVVQIQKYASWDVVKYFYLELLSHTRLVPQIGPSRTVENYPTLALPKTFEELQQVPLDKTYNLLMSSDKTSIDKEIQRLGVGALLFWELPKVEAALNEMCRKWFSNYS